MFNPFNKKNDPPSLDQSIPAMIMSIKAVLADTQKTKLANAVYEVIKDHLDDPHKEIKQMIKANSIPSLHQEEAKAYFSYRLEKINGLSENMKIQILNELVK